MKKRPSEQRIRFCDDLGALPSVPLLRLLGPHTLHRGCNIYLRQRCKIYLLGLPVPKRNVLCLCKDCYPTALPLVQRVLGHSKPGRHLRA